MKLGPNVLLVPLALLAAGLVAVVVVQTTGALAQVDRAQQEKAETLQRTVISAIRGVVRYGRDKRQRIEAVLDEIAKDPIVLSVGVLDEAGAVVVARGARRTAGPAVPPAGDGDRRGDVLELRDTFELSSQHGGCGSGCGAHQSGCCGHGGDVPPGSYRLVLALDRRPAAGVRRVILLEAVALSLIIVLAMLAGWLLVRSIRQRERLSRRIELERQKSESLESLRLLAAGLAHEIRNPLGAIRGYAQLLHEQAAGEEQRTATGVMLSELDRVSERLAEFLAFARQHQVEPRTLDLAQLAEEVVVLLGPDAEAAGIELSLGAAARPVECQGDPQRLKELVLNLVLNAIEACTAGDSVTLTLSRRRGGVELAVSDTGKGIEPADLPRVFEPYFSTRPGGSGLGLAISKRIAESHCATLSIDSTPAVGTSVRLSLPTEG